MKAILIALLVAVAVLAGFALFAHAAPVTDSTPLLSLDRAYPYLTFQQERTFHDLSASEPSWHGSVGLGLGYVVTERFSVSSLYAAGLKGDPNTVRLTLKLALKK